MSTSNGLLNSLPDVGTGLRGPKTFYDLYSITKNDDRTGYIFTSLQKWANASGTRGSSGEKAQQVVIRNFMKEDRKQVRIFLNFTLKDFVASTKCGNLPILGRSVGADVPSASSYVPQVYLITNYINSRISPHGRVNGSLWHIIQEKMQVLINSTQTPFHQKTSTPFFSDISPN